MVVEAITHFNGAVPPPSFIEERGIDFVSCSFADMQRAVISVSSGAIPHGLIECFRMTDLQWIHSLGKNEEEIFGGYRPNEIHPRDLDQAISTVALIRFPDTGIRSIRVGGVHHNSQHVVGAVYDVCGSPDGEYDNHIVATQVVLTDEEREWAGDHRAVDAIIRAYGDRSNPYANTAFITRAMVQAAKNAYEGRRRWVLRMADHRRNPHNPQMTFQYAIDPHVSPRCYFSVLTQTDHIFGLQGNWFVQLPARLQEAA